MTGSYHCDKCGEDKPADDFYPSRRNACKECLKKPKSPPLTKEEAAPVEPLLVDTSGPAIAPVEQKQPKDIPPRRMCVECNQVFDEYERGCTKPYLCQDCLHSRLKKGVEVRLSHVLPAPNKLVIIFEEEDFHLLEALKRDAKLQRRDPTKQLLYYLESLYGSAEKQEEVG